MPPLSHGSDPGSGLLPRPLRHLLDAALARYEDDRPALLGVLILAGFAVSLVFDAARAPFLGILITWWLALVGYLVAILNIDRHEEEPWKVMATAFAWGAVPAVASSIAGEWLAHGYIGRLASPGNADLVEGAVIAPLVEESAKMLAVLFVYHRHHKEFDGTMDGMLYAALVAFGFTVTENLFYWLRAPAEVLPDLLWLRGFVFGLTHVFFTCFAGYGLGVARHAAGPATVIAPALGFGAAVLFHGLHNTLTTLDRPHALFVLQGIVAMLVYALLRRAERDEEQILRDELAVDVAHGRLFAPELDHLLSVPARNAVRRAALRRPHDREAQRRWRLQSTAVELAYARRKLSSAPDDIVLRRSVESLCDALVEARK